MYWQLISVAAGSHSGKPRSISLRGLVMGRSPMAFLCNGRSPLAYRYMGDPAVASFFGCTRLCDAVSPDP
ncbi:MAG: hypothetical protein GDA43_18730 [Hormoscilla sp. SP5CHS1]|nr:hypothetical protein [Hormoscilla sp. SP5CHS1]